jgi:DNA-binding CsgD family transcriptional regulator
MEGGWTVGEVPIFDTEVRAIADRALKGSSVRVVGSRLSGRSTIVHAVSSSLELSGWTVHRFAGDRALKSTAFGALSSALKESVPPGAGVLRAATQFLEQITAGSRHVMVVDDADQLDGQSLATIDLVQRRTGIPNVYVLDSAVLPQERPTAWLERWPESVVNVPGLRFNDVHGLLVDVLGRPVDAALVSQIRTKAAGRVGLIRRIAEIAARENRLTPGAESSAPSRTSLWSDDLIPTVEGLIAGLDTSELDELEYIARHGRSTSLHERPAMRLVERGLVQSISGVDPAQHLAIVPPLIIDYLASRFRGISLAPSPSPAEAANHAPDEDLADLLASLRGESDAEPTATARYFAQRCGARERAAYTRWEAMPDAGNAAAWLTAWWESPEPKRDPAHVFAATVREGDEADLANIALAESMWRAATGVDISKVYAPLETFADAHPGWAADAEAMRLLIEGIAGVTVSIRKRLDRLAADSGPSPTVQTVLALFDVYALEPTAAIRRLDGLQRTGAVPHLSDFIDAIARFAAGDVDDALVRALRSRTAARRNADPDGYLTSSYVAAVSLIQRGQFDEAIAVIDGALALGRPGFLANMVHDAMVRLSAVPFVDSFEARQGARPSAPAALVGPLPGVGRGFYDLLSTHVPDDAVFDAAVANLIEQHMEMGFPLEASLGGIHCLCLRPGPKTLQRLRALYVAHGIGEHDQLLGIARAILEADAPLILDLVKTYDADNDVHQVGMLLRRQLQRWRTPGRCAAQLEMLQQAVEAFATAFPDTCGHIAIRAASPGEGDLSQRELQIGHLAGHLSNNEIAARLRLSVRTVENHISKAMRKTGTKSRAELSKEVRGLPT